MANQELLPRVKRDKIMDKSKADYVAKATFCAQGFWFLVQIVARITAHLPVTLLESNTFAHVLCSIILWAIWWCKPKDVNEPQTISVTPVQAAILSEDARFKKVSPPITSTRSVGGISPKPPRWRRYVPPQRPASEIIHIQIREAIAAWEKLSGRLKIKSIESAMRMGQGVIMLIPGEEILGFCWVAPYPVHLNQQMVEKLRLLGEFNESDEYKEVKDKVDIWKSEERYSTQMPSLTRKVGNVPDQLLDRSIWPLLGLSIMGFIYGGVHLLSWNSHFPTASERILWRIAGCVIAGGGFVILGLMEISIKRWRYLVSVIISLFALLIGFMRLYLVLEAFISVRSLPYGAYQTVGWVGMLPHAG